MPTPGAALSWLPEEQEQEAEHRQLNHVTFPEQPKHGPAACRRARKASPPLPPATALPAACALCSRVPRDRPNNPRACNTARFCLCSHNLCPFFFSVSSTHPGKGKESKQESTPCSSLARERLSPSPQRCCFRVRAGEELPGGTPSAARSLKREHAAVQFAALTVVPTVFLCLILSSVS